MTNVHTDELWQIFSDNGTPIANKGGTPDDFEYDKSLTMGNSHIWFWKSDGKTTEILLQKRSLTKKNRPGWYHASACGHINVGETAIVAAAREAKEEMGIDVDTEKLYFAQATRIPVAPRDIVHVYLYRLKGDEEFKYIDGEVDSVEWRTLDNFKEITKDAEANHLVPQGELYFDTLVVALEHIASKS